MALYGTHKSMHHIPALSVCSVLVIPDHSRKIPFWANAKFEVTNVGVSNCTDSIGGNFVT